VEENGQEEEVIGHGEAHELDDDTIAHEHGLECLVGSVAETGWFGFEELVRGVPLGGVEECTGGLD
jgi:hypothetical protein